MTVTVIETENRQHNVVPSQCKFVIDALNERYSFDEILDALRANLKVSSNRAARMKSTSISMDHPLVQAGLALGRRYWITHYLRQGADALSHPEDGARRFCQEPYRRRIHIPGRKSGRIGAYIQLVSQLCELWVKEMQILRNW